ncbi:MAG: sterol desaturase family protein [Balneolaceae bacterium]|nr:sterol desaturase family protein [Balneolaceae bacterium]
MESLIDFFSDLPTTFRAGLLIGGILVFWILEGVFPLFQFGYKKVRHAAINLVLNGFFLLIGLGFAGLLVWSSDYVTANEFGVLQWVEMPVWMQAIVGVMLLDFFGAYLIHWIEHKVKFLWKFHLVHHSDTTVDVTTGLRHHPGEAVFRMVFTIIGVIMVGAPIWIIFLYQSISALFAHMTHANINMPKKVDRALSYVFITPLMHKVHHHYTQPLTDTNYGNIFAVWDRLFGTFAEVEDMKELTYGIDTHMDPEENDRLGNLLKIPFQSYRPPTGSKFGDDVELKD